MKTYKINIPTVIGRLKAFVSNRPEIVIKLEPFKYSENIDDHDEYDINLVEDVYPTKADAPKRTYTDDFTLEMWREECQVLISGISIPVGMSYTDVKGETTKRQVEAKKIFRHEAGLRYMCGFCILRAAFRTFREDRMLEIIDLESGETFEDPGTWFDKYSLFDTVKMEKLQVMLHIWSYLARADRKFCDAEKAMISAIIRDYCDGNKMKQIEDYAFNHKVQKKDFMAEVSKLAYMDQATVAFLIDKAEQLITADGKVTKKENEVINILRSEYE